MMEKQIPKIKKLNFFNPENQSEDVKEPDEIVDMKSFDQNKNDLEGLIEESNVMSESNNMGSVVIKHLVTANDDEDKLQNDIDFKSNLEDFEVCPMSAMESINRFLVQRKRGRHSLIIVEHIERLKRSKVSIKAKGREGLQGVLRSIWDSMNVPQQSTMSGLFQKRQ